MKKVLLMSIVLLAPSFISAMNETKSQEQESSQATSSPTTALSMSGEVKAVLGDDMSVKIYNAKTGKFISNVGSYSVGDSQGEAIKSLRFSGDNIIYLLDSNGKALETILLYPNYQYRSQESLFNPREVNLTKYKVV
ncbi:hypothetical protein H0X06_03425 [Candidatus Dependentiae bacterium]|nr:hypothetical protein [Candidatus Dependentiae bacterium]